MFKSIKKVKSLSVQEWLVLNPQNYKYIKEELIFPETEVEYQTFKTLFDTDINFRAQKRKILPFYVRSIKNGKCYTRNGLVFTHDDYALKEYSCEEIHPFTKKRRYKLNKPKKIAGKVALLSIDPIHTSYYHWIIESLPRLYLIEKSSFKPDKYIVCNITKFQKQALEMLGISENRVIETENNHLIQADELIATDLINNFELIYFKDIQYFSKKYFPDWICDFYREKFVSQVEKTKPKKIYISRNSTKKSAYRKVLNEDEILKCLESKGFKSYKLEDIPLKEQVELFANAEIIVSPHGAGLTNLVFCPSSTKVVEFYSPNYTDIRQRIIADTLNIEYRYILGEKLSDNVEPQFEDVYLDINKLEKTLKDIENPQKLTPLKKDMAIVLGTTGNRTFAAANVLMGLKKYLKNTNFEIIIYIQDVSKKDRKLLYSILPCRFIDYKLPNADEIREKTKKRYTELSYSRYECFNLLDYYKKVLWLDIDILIQKDLTEFINSTSNGIALWQSKVRTGFNFTEKIESYNMDVPFYNLGIMLITDDLPNYKKLTKWCYDKTAEYGKYLVCADQGIINIMIQEFNLEVNKLPEDFNFHPEEGKKPENAVILHPYAEEKFWNFYFNYKEWNENNQKWIVMGGTPYKGK
ncbi:MAG: glycosyltransferase 61 family protein, partial [Candidatus Gastranaerophilales bacterium]|nr:glycosyltransferase 61 family protein [Candidatus Gastranaerophilales bacterium]